jgi:hypothetical protein
MSHIFKDTRPLDQISSLTDGSQQEEKNKNFVEGK